MAKKPGKPKAKAEKGKGGRPSSFREEFIVQAEKLALLGATDKQLADFFGVSEVTLNAWKKEFPDFLKSLKKGKLEADAEIAQALFHRAKGYSHEAVKFFVIDKAVVAQSYTEHYPPDTAAAIIWLKNRQPNTWREKPVADDDEDVLPVKVEITVKDARKPDAVAE